MLSPARVPVSGQLLSACGTKRTSPSPPKSHSRALAPLRLFLLALRQPRHDLDEGAGAVAVVQLEFEDAFPGVLAGARRARQRKDQRAFGETAAGAGLRRRRADRLIAQHVE